MSGETHEWMKAAEVAQLLGVSPETVRRYVRLGELPANRLPSGHLRIRRGDAMKLLREHQEEG